MQTTRGDTNSTQLLGKISSSLLSHTPVSLLQTHFPLQLMCIYLYFSYNCLHFILLSEDTVHVIILHCTVKPSTMIMQSGNSFSCSTVSYLLHKGRGKIGQTVKLKVALLSVLQALICESYCTLISSRLSFYKTFLLKCCYAFLICPMVRHVLSISSSLISSPKLGLELELEVTLGLKILINRFRYGNNSPEIKIVHTKFSVFL